MLIFQTILRKHQCCDLKGVFALRLLFVFLDHLDFLTDLMKHCTKNVGMVMLQFNCKFFGFFCFLVRHVIFSHKFDCCIWTMADVDIALHVYFLASEMFGHIFLFWKLSTFPSMYKSALYAHREFWIFHLLAELPCYVVYFICMLFYHHPIKYAFGTNLMYPHYLEERFSFSKRSFQ